MERAYYPDEVTDFFLRFAFLCGIIAFFLLIFGISAVAPVVTAVFAVACSMFPVAAMPLFLVFIKIRNFAGYIFLTFIIGTVYYAIILPASLILKLFGTDMLSLFMDLGQNTYWVERTKRDWNILNGEKSNENTANKKKKGQPDGNSSSFGGDPGKE